MLILFCFNNDPGSLCRVRTFPFDTAIFGTTVLTLIVRHIHGNNSFGENFQNLPNRGYSEVYDDNEFTYYYSGDVPLLLGKYPCSDVKASNLTAILAGR